MPTQKRRVKSTSSGFGPSSAIAADSSSSPMPQIGQDPGGSAAPAGASGRYRPHRNGPPERCRIGRRVALIGSQLPRLGDGHGRALHLWCALGHQMHPALRTVPGPSCAPLGASGRCRDRRNVRLDAPIGGRDRSCHEPFILLRGKPVAFLRGRVDWIEVPCHSRGKRCRDFDCVGRMRDAVGRDDARGSSGKDIFIGIARERPRG